MTGPTHKQYAVCTAYIVAMLMYRYDMSEINYYITLPVIIMSAKYGGLFPDIDHNWQYVSDKTTIHWVINKLIRLTGGKHRSWQTHSIDITLILSVGAYLLPKKLEELGIISVVNKEIMMVILFGFMAGWISHIFSDMMTSAGVRVFAISSRKIAFVPDKLFGFRFKTGGEWERFNYKAMKLLRIILGALSLIYPLLLNKIM